MISRRIFVGSLVAAMTARASPPKKVTCVLVGDSHAGYLATHFRKQARDWGVLVDVFAKPGSSVRQFLRMRWMELVRQRHPEADTIVVVLGTNCTRVERPGIGEDLRRLCAIADEGGEVGRSVIALPPPMRLSTAYLTDAVKTLSVYSFEAGPLPMMSDRIHATTDGYATWADKIATVLWA